MNRGSSYYEIHVPLSGGYLKLSVKIPNVGVLGEQDAKFIDTITEQVTSHLHAVIIRERGKMEMASTAQPAVTSRDRDG